MFKKSKNHCTNSEETLLKSQQNLLYCAKIETRFILLIWKNEHKCEKNTKNHIKNSQKFLNDRE